MVGLGFVKLSDLNNEIPDVSYLFVYSVISGIMENNNSEFQILIRHLKSSKMYNRMAAPKI
jgi:hypothetical protein